MLYLVLLKLNNKINILLKMLKFFKYSFLEDLEWKLLSDLTIMRCNWPSHFILNFGSKHFPLFSQRKLHVESFLFVLLQLFFVLIQTQYYVALVIFDTHSPDPSYRTTSVWDASIEFSPSIVMLWL